MTSREEFAQEMLLRENVRKAIIVAQRKKLNEGSDSVLRRIHLRSILKDLILEAAADPDEDPHPSTGINILRDLIKNSNFLKTIRTGYKALTTAEEQRTSYRAHMISAIQHALAPVMMNSDAGTGKGDIHEDIDIEVEEEEKFIEGEPENAPTAAEEEEEVESDPKDDFGLEGEEITGRDRAYEDFKDIEQTIINSFGMLSNPDDQEKFYDYLIANTKLYFDRFETELQAKVEEPTNSEYDNAETPEPESDVPEEESLDMEEFAAAAE